MKDQELVNALREHAEWQRGNEWETPITLGDDLVEAADRIANQDTHILALQKEIEKLRGQLDIRRCALCDYWLGEADPRCMCGKSPWGGKTVPKDSYCSHWEHHTDWIPVTEQLPEFGETVFAIVEGKPAENITLIGALQLATLYDDGWCVEQWPEWQGAIVTRWMPLPEPPEVEL